MFCRRNALTRTTASSAQLHSLLTLGDQLRSVTSSVSNVTSLLALVSLHDTARDADLNLIVQGN
jgi:hypothetical protein